MQINQLKRQVMEVKEDLTLWHIEVKIGKKLIAISWCWSGGGIGEGWGKQAEMVKQPLLRCVLITVSVGVIQGGLKFLLPEDSNLVSI